MDSADSLAWALMKVLKACEDRRLDPPDEVELVRCPQCEGTAWVNNDPCPMCEDGQVERRSE